jgi:integrase
MMARRGNNEGNIKKRRDGRWEARLSLPDGTRKSFYGKTRQEVAKQLSATLRDIQQGLPVVSENQTLQQYLSHWLDTLRYGNRIDPSSWDRYEAQVRNHIVPELGKIVLSRLTPQRVQMLYTKLLKKGYSSTTVHHVHAVLGRALNDALRLGLVQRNVCQMVDSPQPSTRLVEPFSEDEAALFLDAVKGERLEAAYVMALMTGLRRSELCALRWQDVDLDMAIAYVRYGFQRQGAKFVLAEPKSSYSRRRIFLPQVLVHVLSEYKEKQAQEKALIGVEWGDDHPYVFTTEFGRHINPPYLSDFHFPRMLAKSGVGRELHFHDLRHTAATLLLARGVNPKVVSELLGHASVAFTLKIYGHVTPKMQQIAADTMDNIFKGR